MRLWSRFLDMLGQSSMRARAKDGAVTAKKIKGRQAVGVCIYCGTVGPITEDHIPPKNLFGKPLPPGILQVLACTECNNRASKEDESFRSRMAFRKDIKDHEVIKQIRPIVIRSFERKEQAGFARGFLRTLRPIEFPGPPGPEPAGLTYDVELHRLYRVVSRVTHGYHFNQTGQRIDLSSCYVGVLGAEELEAAPPEFLEQTRQQFAATPITTIGYKVFAFQGVRDLGDRRITVWLMTFYDHVTFLSATLPYEADQVRADVG